MFAGADTRTYVRLTAVADPVVTKLVLLAVVMAERVAVRSPVVSPASAEVNGGGQVLPLRSRRARAAALAGFSGAAD